MKLTLFYGAKTALRTKTVTQLKRHENNLFECYASSSDRRKRATYYKDKLPSDFILVALDKEII